MYWYNSLTLPAFAKKDFNNLRDENGEPIFTYTDPFMRNVVRQSVKGGRCNAFNQFCKSAISDEVFKNISKELNVIGNICEILEKYFDFLNKFEKKNAEKFDSKYDDYRDIDQKEKTDFFNKKLNMLSIHKELSKIYSNNTQMDYDATSLSPSAMWDRPMCHRLFFRRVTQNKDYIENFCDDINNPFHFACGKWYLDN